MELVIETVRADWEAFLRFAPRLFYGLLILVFFLIAARYAGRLTTRALQRSRRFRRNMRLVQFAVSWFIGSIGVLLALGLMGFTGVAASLLATGGIVAIVLGFAFREIGENLLAGLFLMFSRPFKIGDQISTGGLTGIVRAIELRYVHIRTFDACDVFVPNAQILREPLHNYTRDGLRRPSFVVSVGYDEDPEQVIAILKEAARAVPDVLAEPEPAVTVKNLGVPYIEYEVSFWLDLDKTERGQLAATNDVKMSCWRVLQSGGMAVSTDITAGLDIRNLPDMKVVLLHPDEAD